MTIIKISKLFLNKMIGCFYDISTRVSLRVSSNYSYLIGILICLHNYLGFKYSYLILIIFKHI